MKVGQTTRSMNTTASWCFFLVYLNQDVWVRLSRSIAMILKAEPVFDRNLHRYNMLYVVSKIEHLKWGILCIQPAIAFTYYRESLYNDLTPKNKDHGG